MDKTLFRMLDDIYARIDCPFYDELTDYEKGIKDMLNLLDTRMSGNDVEHIYDFIMTTIRNNHEFSYDYYYQIDYIDGDGLANYISTFDNNEREKAIKAVQLLNQANMCINGTTTKYVLDHYRYKLDKDGHAIDDTDEVIEQNINEEV